MVFVSQAFGEARVKDLAKDGSSLMQQMQYTALLRCGKDLGIASELWDPVWHHQRRHHFSPIAKSM